VCLKIVAVALLAAAGGMTACSSSQSSGGAPREEGGAAQVPPFAVEQHVAAGTDVYVCSYLAVSSADTFLVGVSHVATAGTHHVLVFRTDLTSIPDGSDAPVDCFAGPSSPMRHMRGEVYGSQARTGSFSFPAGVGLPVRAGEVLLVEVHFLDAGAQDIDARVDLTLATTTKGIATPAGAFFFDDPFIDIPAAASARASMRCLVPDDVTIVSTSFHGHAHAQAVTAFVDPPTGAPASTPYYTAPDAANPLPLQASVPVAAGSHVRFACEFFGGPQEILQGLDFQASEMCALSGAYYPAMGSQAESCALAPDDFGTGSATCAQTLACAGACPAGSAPPADLGLSTVPNVDPCWQRCVVASCPRASALLLALVRCEQNNCGSECAAPSSAACAACRTTHCPTEASACAGDTCGP